MDQVKRAATRLRRLVPLNPTNRGNPFSVQQLATAGQVLSLRQTIDHTVVAFIPPALPLFGQDLICSAALVEFWRFGRYIFNARLEATTQNTVYFLLGFATSQSSRYAGSFGALNFPGGQSGDISPINKGILKLWGFSQWLKDNYDAAIIEGVIFRIYSTTDRELSPREIALRWSSSFGGGLYRQLHILDTDRDFEIQSGANYDTGGGTITDDPGDEGLSFEVSLLFE